MVHLYLLDLPETTDSLYLVFRSWLNEVGKEWIQGDQFRHPLSSDFFQINCFTATYHCFLALLFSSPVTIIFSQKYRYISYVKQVTWTWLVYLLWGTPEGIDLFLWLNLHMFLWTLWRTWVSRKCCQVSYILEFPPSLQGGSDCYCSHL